MTTESVPTDITQIRERLKLQIDHLPAPQLRALADQMAPPAELRDWQRAHLNAAPEGAFVIRFPDDKMKLSTDPAEMPPYGPPITVEEFRAEMKDAEESLDRGEGVPAREVLAGIDARIAAKFGK